MGTASLSILGPSKPTPAPEEEDSQNPSTALLLSDTNNPNSPPKPSTKNFLLIFLLLTACIFLGSSIAFAFLFFSSSQSPTSANSAPTHRPLPHQTPQTRHPTHLHRWVPIRMPIQDPNNQHRPASSPMGMRARPASSSSSPPSHSLPSKPSPRASIPLTMA
eukprot:TRINITY_DN7168_c0_g2_i9.p1 TRINITY_DN7168_c0_g2~~TRINITY_DN7168_c0_g2_i9.p1  ORF type:complete len:162 (+),score=15.37 TRINITY_DN7168_c0_g2_i9:255-740(+)